MKVLRKTSLWSNFTGSYKKECSGGWGDLSAQKTKFQ